MLNITDAVLASSLKELQKDGMSERKSFDTIPPHVEYSLSERGRSVVPILRSICQWAGIFHKSGSGHVMKQCEKCDYRNP